MTIIGLSFASILLLLFRSEKRISIISITKCEDFNYFNYTMRVFQGWDANDVSARERFTAFLISPCVEEVRFFYPWQRNNFDHNFERSTRRRNNSCPSIEERMYFFWRNRFLSALNKKDKQCNVLRMAHWQFWILDAPPNTYNWIRYFGQILSWSSLNLRAFN